MRLLFGGHGFLDDDQWRDAAVADPLGHAKAGLNAELDALAAFVTSLRHAPNSPLRAADGTLSPQAQTGKLVFRRLGCNFCHGDAAWSDSARGLAHDLGTIGPASGRRLGEPLKGIDTPSLLGLWATAPYLHDGSAPDLAAALRLADRGGWHGDVAQLDADEFDALLAYLRQIDARETPLRSLPAVTLARPRASVTVQRGQSVTLAANTASGLGEVERVGFLVDGVSVGMDSQAVYTVDWTPTTPGKHTITVELRYANGAKTRSAPVTVTVE
jgi:hypothetical protein